MKENEKQPVKKAGLATHLEKLMSTRSTIKSRFRDCGPEFHVYEQMGDRKRVYLNLVEVEVVDLCVKNGIAEITLAIPRGMAGELGLIAPPHEQK